MTDINEKAAAAMSQEMKRLRFWAAGNGLEVVNLELRQAFGLRECASRVARFAEIRGRK